MEVLHHYSTEVSDLSALEGRNVSKWRNEIPALAFSSSCVLHALLAFSALHLAHTSTGDRRAEFRNRGAYHYSLTLPQMVQSLPEVDDTTANTLYVAASLLCFYSLAKGPQPGQYLGFSDEGEAEWLWL